MNPGPKVDYTWAGGDTLLTIIHWDGQTKLKGFTEWSVIPFWFQECFIVPT